MATQIATTIKLLHETKVKQRQIQEVAGPFNTAESCLHQHYNHTSQLLHHHASSAIASSSSASSTSVNTTQLHHSNSTNIMHHHHHNSSISGLEKQILLRQTRELLLERHYEQTQRLTSMSSSISQEESLSLFDEDDDNMTGFDSSINNASRCQVDAHNQFRSSTSQKKQRNLSPQRKRIYKSNIADTSGTTAAIPAASTSTVGAADVRAPAPPPNSPSFLLKSQQQQQAYMSHTSSNSSLCSSQGEAMMCGIVAQPACHDNNINEAGGGFGQPQQAFQVTKRARYL